MRDDDDDNGSPRPPSAAASYRDALLHPEPGWIQKVSKHNSKNKQNQDNSDPFKYDDIAGFVQLSSLASAANKSNTSTSEPASNTVHSANYLEKLRNNRNVPPSFLRKSLTCQTPPPDTIATDIPLDSPNINLTNTTTPPGHLPPRPRIPIHTQSNQHWFILEIPQLTNTDNHLSESLLNFLQLCYYFDAKIQFIPIPPKDLSKNPYAKPKPQTPLRGSHVPKNFPDSEAIPYLAKSHPITRDILTRGNKVKTTYLHLKIQIQTYTTPHELASAIKAIYREQHP